MTPQPPSHSFDSTEEWRQIPEAPSYEVSDQGRVCRECRRVLRYPKDAERQKARRAERRAAKGDGA